MTENKADAKIEGIGLDALFMDREAIEAGEWVKDLPGFPGVEVLTRGWNCAEAIAMRDLQMKMRDPRLIEGTDEYEAATKGDKLAHERELQRQIKEERSELLIRVLIKDWRGLAGIPFSENNLRIICTNDNALVARQALLNAALKCGQLKGSRDEAQLKNFVAGLGISFDLAGSTTVQ